MTTLTTEPSPLGVGHRSLTPSVSTTLGLLQRVGLGRSTLAELLGGWLVQTPSWFVTGTPTGAGLADVAVVNRPTPSTLSEVAALRPDHHQPDLVWSLEPIPAVKGWTSRPKHVLARFPRTSPGTVEWSAGRNGPRVARVADATGVALLRSILHGLDLTEPIDGRLLGTPAVRSWIVDDGRTPGALFATVVGHFDVLAAVAGTPRSIPHLVHAWRRDRPDLEGLAVLPTEVVVDEVQRAGAQEVFVATREPQPVDLTLT